MPLKVELRQWHEHMKFLPFNTDPKTQLLRPRYLLRIAGLNLLCIFLGASIGAYIGSWLAILLQLGDGPVREQPHGLLWAVLFFLGFILSVVVCHLLSFLLMAVTLRWSYGWSWPRIRELMFESRIPAHWQKPALPPPVAKRPPPRWARITANILAVLLGAGMIAMGRYFPRDDLPMKIVNVLAGVVLIGLAVHALLREMKNRPK
jgi:hypothetical protein